MNHDLPRLRRLLSALGRSRLRVLLALALLAVTSVTSWAIVTSTELSIVKLLHQPVHEKTFMNELNDLVRAGRNLDAFNLAFERGDTIFGNTFNAVDGSGVNVGTGERYSHVPRADLTGAGQWASHTPPRVTGPNAAGCFECHNVPFEDGAGLPSGNVHRDPTRSATMSKFIQRNTPHLFGSGAVQRLAEEMTDDLRNKIKAAIAQCAAIGCNIPVTLTTKGINYGTVVINRISADPPPNNCNGTDAIPFIDPADCLAGVTADITGLVGIAKDLVVRGFQWKGAVAFIRDFNRDASNQEIGMQSVELAGEEVDGDFDGVVNELRVGDQSALALYIAAQPRPTTRQELTSLNLLPTEERVGSTEASAISRGSSTFAQIGCATCHVPSLTINKATFSEPSQNVNFRDRIFPAGQDPISRSLDPALAVKFDLTKDQPDNRVIVNGVEVRFGAFQKGSASGSAIVRLYGDLKRHNMGPRLAEQIDEIGSGASVFLTENLWGVGSTAPYLHDGRATTLTEAILEHGGEAQASRDAFAALSTSSKTDVITFLNNQVLFTLEEE